MGGSPYLASGVVSHTGGGGHEQGANKRGGGKRGHTIIVDRSNRYTYILYVLVLCTKDSQRSFFFSFFFLVSP